jgi:hypothetical protein
LGHDKSASLVDLQVQKVDGNAEIITQNPTIDRRHIIATKNTVV